jgi:hypothetical protein
MGCTYSSHKVCLKKRTDSLFKTEHVLRHCTSKCTRTTVKATSYSECNNLKNLNKIRTLVLLTRMLWESCTLYLEKSYQKWKFYYLDRYNKYFHVCRQSRYPCNCQMSLRPREKNLQATQLVKEMEFFPPSQTPNIKTYETCAALVPFTTRNLAYHDLTGRFPHRSTRGNQYLLIVYDFDSNAILHVSLKTKTGAEIKRA